MGYHPHWYFIGACASVFLSVNSCLIWSRLCQTSEKAVFSTWPHPGTPGANYIKSFSKFALQISSYVLWLCERVTFMTSWVWWLQQSPQGAGQSTATSSRVFRGAVAGFPPLQCHWSIKRKNNNNPSVERFTLRTAPGLKQTIVADWWEEGDRMISMERTVTFVAIKGTYALFQLQI